LILPFESGSWSWGDVEHRPATLDGRRCTAASGFGVVLADVELQDGTIELELAVGRERAFHGVVWRARDTENYESFFVRPHQVGNSDAIQYTPVFNGISSWQLYHGDGFWAAVGFPLGEWFRIRIVFAGDRAETYVTDLEEPALVSVLKAPADAGRVGVLVGGPDVHLGAFACHQETRFRVPPPTKPAARPEVVREWDVSDAFPESLGELALAETRTWTTIESEPSGLVNLARVQGICDGRNTVLARTRIHADQAVTRRLELGFSDRAVVYLNGVALYRGDDTYRSRDYRFLGSIGWYDALYLPLVEGDNELVVAVSEELGGWGVQARLR